MRDWLYVTDHCAALRVVLQRGRIGETYNIGGNVEKTNIDVVKTICAILDELRPDPRITPHHSSLITFGPGPPGPRPALCARHAQNPRRTRLATRASNSQSGIRETIAWYLDNRGLGAQCDERRI